MTRTHSDARIHWILRYRAGPRARPHRGRDWRAGHRVGHHLDGRLDLEGGPAGTEGSDGSAAPAGCCTPGTGKRLELVLRMRGDGGDRSTGGCLGGYGRLWWRCLWPGRAGHGPGSLGQLREHQRSLNPLPGQDGALRPPDVLVKIQLIITQGGLPSGSLVQRNGDVHGGCVVSYLHQLRLVDEALVGQESSHLSFVEGPAPKRVPRQQRDPDTRFGRHTRVSGCAERITASPNLGQFREISPELPLPICLDRLIPGPIQPGLRRDPDGIPGWRSVQFLIRGWFAPVLRDDGRTPDDVRVLRVSPAEAVQVVDRAHVRRQRADQQATAPEELSRHPSDRSDLRSWVRRAAACHLERSRQESDLFLVGRWCIRCHQRGCVMGWLTIDGPRHAGIRLHRVCQLMQEETG